MNNFPPPAHTIARVNAQPIEHRTKQFEVYAPVIIPTLCRYEHFKRCIDSLGRCTGAEYTDVYIGIDYPTKEEHWDGYKKICDYVLSIEGFKNIIVYKREKNYGATQNSLDLKKHVKEKYDRFIVSEDDNEFAPTFLEYMNDGLTRFKDNPEIIRICGCFMPWNGRDKVIDWKLNAFPAKDFNASGVGCWFNKLPMPPFAKNQVLKSWKLTFKAIRLGYGTAITRMLVQINKESQLLDVCIRLYCAFESKFCIFPTVSKVKNWGYDGTGLNSDNDPRLIELQTLDNSKDYIMDDFEIKDYPEIETYVKELYDYGGKAKLMLMVKYIFYRITGKRIGDVISMLKNK